MLLTGFSLMELLVVIIIAGILAAIAFPKYGRVTEHSRQAEAITILGALRGAQLKYYVDNNDSYTTDLTKLDIELPTPKFFTYTLPGVPELARAARNGVQQTGGSSGYQLSIDRNGNISCRSGDDCP